MNIIYEDNHIIVVKKEPNVPTQSDNSKDLDVLTIIKNYIKKKYNKPGNVYVGMVHRLDRPVGGVMVFAKTSKAASRLSNKIRNNEFYKKYYAIVHGKMEYENGSLENYLLKNEELNTSSIVPEDTKGAKKASLDYKVLKYDSQKNLSLIDIDLHTGRHHQIRVQLAGANHPIYGDQRYGTMNEEHTQIYLWAYKISFKHPVKDEIMAFEDIPDWDII